MRKLPFILALSVLFSCGERPAANHEEKSVSGSEIETTTGSTTKSPDASRQLTNIEDIKQEYDSVMSKVNSNHADSSSFTYNCRGEKKGKVVYFSDTEGLRLIRHTYDEYSHFSATDEYFVKDDSLFFVFYKHVAWSFDTPAQGESQTIDKVTEKRFYIIKNEALKCLEKKYTIRSASSENLQPQLAANRETDCSSLEGVLKKFELLAGYRSQEENPECPRL